MYSDVLSGFRFMAIETLLLFNLTVKINFDQTKDLTSLKKSTERVVSVLGV